MGFVVPVVTASLVAQRFVNLRSAELGVALLEPVSVRLVRSLAGYLHQRSGVVVLQPMPQHRPVDLVQEPMVDLVALPRDHSAETLTKSIPHAAVGTSQRVHGHIKGLRGGVAVRLARQEASWPPCR
jgi:hypothetical protein